MKTIKRYFIFIILIGIVFSLSIFSCKGSCAGSKEAYVTNVQITETGEVELVYSDKSTTKIGEIAANNGDKYVVNGRLNENGGLVLIFNDNSEVEVGNVISNDAIVVSNINIDSNGELIVTFSNGQKTNLGNVSTSQIVSIKNIELNDKNQLIITYTNGFTTNLGAINYPDLVSIDKVYVNVDGHLIIITSDGKTTDAGCVVGEKGEPGQDGRGIETVYINDNGELIVVLTDKTEINLGVIITEQHGNKPKNDEERLQNVSDALVQSKPTRVSTNISYYRPDLQITLNHASTLVIEYSQMIKSMYSYSHQKLNPITDVDKGMISTYSGTIYSKGSTLGSLQNGKIEWYTDIEGSISLFNINFNKDFFEQGIKLTDTSFVGKLKQESIVSFFGKAYDATDIELTFILSDDYKSIERVGVTYKKSNGALVRINCIYGYGVEKLDEIN